MREERKEEGGSEVFVFVFCSVAKWKLLQLQVNLLFCLSFIVHSVLKLASRHDLYFFKVEISVYELEA